MSETLEQQPLEQEITTGSYVVARDKNGPIEVEIIGAQPVGETLIESIEHDLPQDSAPIGVGEAVAIDADTDRAVKMGAEAPDHAVRKHHKYGMSKLGYIAACPGFTSTDGASEAAEQGTRLHEIMDLLIERYKTTKKPLLDLLSEWCSENSIDDEERHLLVFCIRVLNEWLPSVKEILNEIRVYIFNPDGSELNHGHLDLLFVFGETGLLIDYKFGWLPVPPAPTNLQGRGYALGAFQKFHRLNKIAVMFIQPKLNAVSKAIYTRPQINEMYQSIRGVIDRADLVQKDPAGTTALLSPSDYCSYCALSKNGTCPAKLAQLRAVATVRADLPLPQELFKAPLEKIDTPQKAALARYWVELLEQEGFLDAIKSRAKEIAQTNGGEITCELPDGQVIRYAIEERRHDRSLGDTLEVATTLKEQNVMSFEQVLCCAELSVTKLEAAGAGAIHEAETAELERQVTAKQREVDALVTAGKMTRTQAKAAVAAVRKEFKTTKKSATEAFQKILENQGLLSRPEGTIPVLRRKKNETKQLNAKN
jgi:polyhydroxyalkanoate synthesis regulator phasin